MVVDYTPQSLRDSPPYISGAAPFFCVVSKVIRCSNKLSPWGRESTAKPGEGTRIVDYTPQSPIPLPLFEVLPLF